MITKIVLLSAFFLFSTVVSAQIEGNVRDPDDKAISGAKLTALDAAGKPSANTQSDARGYYVFKGLKRGKYKVEAIAEGYQLVVFENVEVAVDSYDEKSDMRPGPWLQVTLTPLKPKQASSRTKSY